MGRDSLDVSYSPVLDSHFAFHMLASSSAARAERKCSLHDVERRPVLCSFKRIEGGSAERKYPVRSDYSEREELRLAPTSISGTEPEILPFAVARLPVFFGPVRGIHPFVHAHACVVGLRIMPEPETGVERIILLHCFPSTAVFHVSFFSVRSHQVKLSVLPTTYH